MTEKRFENRLNKNNLKFLYQNPVWDNLKKDALNVFEMIDLLNNLNNENEQLKGIITYLKEVSDSKNNEISELGKQRNYLADENKTLKLKIKILEQVKPIKELPKSIDVVIRNE